jgi:hypothetical protein
MIYRRFAVLSLAVLTLGVLLAPAAGAHGHHGGGSKTYVPPGLSAASQYTEVVPTAGGGSSSVSSGGSGSEGSGSPLPSSVVQQLNHSGSAGKAAAKLAAAGTPTRAVHKPTSRVAPASATASVVGAIAGSEGGGVLLPVVLIGSIVVLSGLGLARLTRRK